MYGVVLGVAVIAIIISVWLIYRGYTGDTLYSTFTGEHEHKLSVDKDLVKNKYVQVLNYLKKIYKKFPESTDVEVVDIYDTLDIIVCSYLDIEFPNILPDGYFYFWKTYVDSNKYTAHSSGLTLDGLNITKDLVGSNNPTMVLGPAPFNFPLNTFTRNIYYPFGPVYDDAFTKWTYLNGIDVTDTSSNMGFLWKHRNWAFGLKEGDSVEVTVLNKDASSPGIWLQPFYGGGTGTFYTVGKTRVGTNKIDVLMKLIKEYKLEYGDAYLQKTYGTSDPYHIVWRYCTSSNMNVWESMSQDVDGEMTIYPKEYIKIQNTGILAASGLLLSNVGKVDIEFKDIAEWYSSEYGVDKNIIKYCIDEVCLVKDWLLDRVCSITSLDEPIYWFGSVLGYRTLQFTINASTNGTWEPLILDLSLPYEWKKVVVEDRKYIFIKNGDNGPYYTDEGVVVFRGILNKILAKYI